jgi:hypothetical protein
MKIWQVNLKCILLQDPDINRMIIYFNFRICFVLLNSPDVVFYNNLQMEKLKFLALADKHGKVERIDMGGMIVLETAIQLKNELVAIENNLCDDVVITIFELEELDLAGVQLFVAFIRKMDQMKINYQFNWNIEEEQKALFTNVGLGVELFINN